MKSEDFTLRNILKGIWLFCRYLFVPQWGRKRGKRDEV